MIQVTLAQEPPDFDHRVRQKGLSAIDELVGRAPRVPHPGRRRKKIAVRETEIPPVKFPPFWRDTLLDLLQAYERRCAFLALYLEEATGNPSVDHMLPKSKQWSQVYEWKNYRLCAASVNSHKNDMVGIVDPVDCRQGWFALEMVGFQVTRGIMSPPAKYAAAIDDTLKILNAPECCRAREEYVTNYSNKEISFDYLNRRAPFVSAELRRQGKLHVGD